MKCNRCHNDFLHGDKVYDNLCNQYCEDCIVEVLVELVQYNVEEAAKKFGFDLCELDARDDSLYPRRRKK